MKIYSAQIGHVVARCGRLKHQHPDRSCDSLNQLPKTCVTASFARSSQEKMPRIESPPYVKHPCITSTPESSSFAVSGLPHVSLLFDLILFNSSCEALCLVCSQCHCRPYQLAPWCSVPNRVEWLLMTSSPVLTHTQTDNYKISITNYNIIMMNHHSFLYVDSLMNGDGVEMQQFLQWKSKAPSF